VSVVVQPVPANIRDQITNQHLQVVYNEIVVPYWDTYLREKGVRRPPGFGTIQAAALCLLSYNYPDTYIWSKEDIVVTLSRLGYRSNDPQPRHLGNQYGFCLYTDDRLRGVGMKLKRGSHWLKTLEETFPGDWSPDRRNGHKGFLQDGRCSTCGGRVGDENWRFTGIIESVSECHADPSLPINEYNRVVQCNICNRQMQDHYALYPDGMVKEVLKPWREG
jgi:hypothetical protein